MLTDGSTAFSFIPHDDKYSNFASGFTTLTVQTAKNDIKIFHFCKSVEDIQKNR